MVHLDTPLGEELLDVAVGQAEAQVSADRQHNHIGWEAEAGEGGARRAAAATPRRSTPCWAPGQPSSRRSTGRWPPQQVWPARPVSAGFVCWMSRPATPYFVDGGAGGVGAATVQMALARGAKVIASASEANQDYLREIDATPVLYGQGLAERVRAAAGGPVDAVFDVAGKTPVQDLISLAPGPSQVVTIANFATGQAGARVTGGGADSQPMEARRRWPSCWPRTGW